MDLPLFYLTATAYRCKARQTNDCSTRRGVAEIPKPPCHFNQRPAPINLVRLLPFILVLLSERRSPRLPLNDLANSLGSRRAVGRGHEEHHSRPQQAPRRGTPSGP